MTLAQTLNEYWGYSTFRPLQQEVIEHVLARKDTILLMSTGGGKSLCYQLPTLQMEGICIVISPLIALMKDQANNLRKRGLLATVIHSGMSKKIIDANLDNCIYGKQQFLFIAPERLEDHLFQTRLKKMKVCLLAIDEAHCISMWGRDFRPAYRKIASIRAILTETPIIAMTATANKKVLADIENYLELKTFQIYKSTYFRANLSYSVLYNENKSQKLIEIIKKIKGTGIVYVRNRKKTKDITQVLNQHKISALHYHAGMNIDDRAKNQDKWINNKVQAIVATNAFGMGIDKPDVRWVIHWDMPDSIEAYYQEAGRAGRDGKKSYAILFNDLKGQFEREEKLLKYAPDKKKVEMVYLALCNFFKLAEGAGLEERFEFDLDLFCKHFNLHPLLVSNTLKFLAQNELITFLEKGITKASLKILVDRELAYKYMISNRNSEAVLKAVFRNYEHVWSDMVSINEIKLAKQLKMTKEQLISAFIHFEKMNLIEYIPQSQLPQIVFLQARVKVKSLQLDFKLLKQNLQIKQANLKSMFAYFNNKKICRSQQLLTYFEEPNSVLCAICDVCTGRHKKILSQTDFKDLHKEIKACLLKENLSLEQLVEANTVYSSNIVIKAIREMLDSNEIARDNNLLFKWQA